MKTYKFFTKNNSKECIWKCKSPDESIAWNMFSLIKGLDLKNLKSIFTIKNK